MRYIAKSLGSNEVLIMLARFHWLFYLRAWLILALTLGTTLYFLTAYRSLPLAVIALAFSIYAARTFLVPLLTTEIGVTSQRLILKRGLLERHTSEMELWAIEALNLDQGVLGRIFGYGHINVQGTGDDSLLLPDIAHPLEFRRAVETAITKSTRPGRSAAGSGI